MAARGSSSNSYKGFVQYRAFWISLGREASAAVTASTLLLPLPPSINWLRQLQGMGPDKLDPLGRYLLRLAATANLCSYLPLRAIVERRAYATYINGAVRPAHRSTPPALCSVHSARSPRLDRRCAAPWFNRAPIRSMLPRVCARRQGPSDTWAEREGSIRGALTSDHLHTDALPAAWWARRKGVAAMLAQKPRSWDAVGCGCMPGPVLPRACVAAAGDMPRQIPGLLQQTRTGRHEAVSQPVAIRALAPKTANNQRRDLIRTTRWP